MPPAKASSIATATLGAQVAVAAMVALAAIRASQAAERCEPAVARIVSIQGLVEVQPAGATDWVLAALDDRLCFGDTVRVGELARAALALANDSVLRFDQRTTLRLAGEVETGRSLLDLLFGAVHFFSHRPRALEVDTPIANAAAEGTEFLVRALPDRTEVVMLDGRVRLTTAEGEVLLASGDAGVAEAGAAPRRAIVARPRDAVAWALYYPPVLASLAAGAAMPALPPGLRRAVERVAANDHAGALAALDAVPEAARDARYDTYRAGVLLNVGRVEEAAVALERALALEPEAADALAQRAIIAVVQNRREEALADARRAAEFAPDSGPAQIALSYALQAAFQLEEARAVLREAAERIPDDPLVFARLAEIELSFGDLRAAQTAAERAAALAPGLSRTQMVLGFAALTRIAIDDAKAAFRRAIELDSAEPLARLGLGLATIRQGALEEGRRELEIAAALDPNNSLLRSYLGKAYFEERRGPLDAAQFRIAKELDPNDPTPWFYDAIRLQTENRPVEALRSLERSIALNDNRAIYRSRLLLDSDNAARTVSLARTYDDLGFEQLGLVEAATSLNDDPTNSAAHRFLSDTYLGQPRLEIARVSELLQAQLLQPLNANPTQPSLAFTDLNLVPGGGPGDVGFNEFTPLFQRNEFQLIVAGLVGDDDTLGDEVVASALWDRLSLSAGQFHFETDGFRPNNDLNHNVYNLFAQFAPTHQIDLQFEYRRRETDQGDRALNFDPSAFSATQRIDINQDVARLGGHLKLSPRSAVIMSGIYTNRQDNFASSDLLTTPGPIPNVLFEESEEATDDALQGEVQYLLRFEDASLIAGFGTYRIDQREVVEEDETPCFFGDCRQRSTTADEVDAANGYVYGSMNWPQSFTWTLGLGYETFEQSVGDASIDVDELTPKVGVQWRPNSWVRLRGAAFRTVKRAVTINQTVEPTQVVGFNQLFDDVNGTKATKFSAAADIRLDERVFLGLEMFLRNTSPPRILIEDGQTRAVTIDQDERQISSYLYWTPSDRLALSAGMSYNEFSQSEKDAGPNPNDVETLIVPVQVNYFDPSGVFAGAGLTYLSQSVRRSATAVGLSGTDNVFLADIAVGYRLPVRRGALSLEVRNIFDESFAFQDESFRSSELLNPRFIPERSILARLSLLL